jgi:squalene-hopene/tetraprenyl-beta-curcumene cyclase
MAARTAGAALRKLPDLNDDQLDATISNAADWLDRRQDADGHWVFELEADATMAAEYITCNHYFDEINEGMEERVGVYLRRTQGADGGWPMYFGGEGDISCSVKSYFALKMIGDDVDAPHMRRARDFILGRGGAAKANVFTRYLMALFGQVPWRAVPLIRPEAVLLPAWAPFHLDKVSYWSRTAMVPMFVVCALKPRARNPRRINIPELFITPPDKERHYVVNPTGHWIGDVFLAVDHLGRLAEPVVAPLLEKLAIQRAMAFVHERLNGEDGLGGIFPPILSARMAMDALGYPRDHPDVVMCRRAIDKLMAHREHESYVQPCLSPVWDTGLALHARLECGVDPDSELVRNATRWLTERQILDVRGDWCTNRPNVRPGGWAFQYRNDYYPDVDDTAVVVMALHRIDREAQKPAIDRAVEWVLGMQGKRGGWGAFDADNEYYLLNNIPFADHGALLDPPTSDVTARCIGMLAQVGFGRDHPAVARALAFLKAEQEEDGSWFGRWGTNYVYGTWSVLCALNAIGEDMQAPYVRRAVDWLKAQQRPDGGWGEDCATYWPGRRGEARASTPSQTAWAMLGLMAAGEVGSDAVRRGVGYLTATRQDDGTWSEEYYNAVGFPRVFYLLYHGYAKYFPLWALARYRNLIRSNQRRTPYGI